MTPLTRTACDRAMQRLAQGDMDALETIYHKLGRNIFLTAYSILGDTHTAQDVMQDTFVKLAATAQNYRADSNAVAYILTVTRNLAIDECNRRKRETPQEELFDADAATPAEEPVPFAELEALQLLSEEDRRLVILKLDGGMTHRELAKLFGITPAACEKRYRRALEKLKPYYQN